MAADVGSDAPEVGEAMGRNGVRKDAVDADEQEHDWVDPEWYVGQDVQEVNEMWERKADAKVVDALLKGWAWRRVWTQ